MNSIPPTSPYSPSLASESSYFLGSYNSNTATNSDVPGPGRLLGKFYGFLGRKVESVASRAVVKLGSGPHEAAMTMRRLIREGTLVKVSNEKKFNKAGKTLVKYIR